MVAPRSSSASFFNSSLLSGLISAGELMLSKIGKDEGEGAFSLAVDCIPSVSFNCAMIGSF